MTDTLLCSTFRRMWSVWKLQACFQDKIKAALLSYTHSLVCFIISLIIGFFIKGVDFVQFVLNCPWILFHAHRHPTWKTSTCLQDSETLSAHPGERQRAAGCRCCWLCSFRSFQTKVTRPPTLMSTPQRYWIIFAKGESASCALTCFDNYDPKDGLWLIHHLWSTLFILFVRIEKLKSPSSVLHYSEDPLSSI